MGYGGPRDRGPWRRAHSGNMRRQKTRRGAPLRVGRVFIDVPTKTMIIKSLLDTDLYKFTMMQVVLHHFPAAQVEYRFKCRTPSVDLAPYIDEIRDEVRAALQRCASRDEELDYLRGCASSRATSSISSALFQLNEKSITIAPSPKNERRDRHHDRRAVAAHDPVRDPGARDRQRGLLPQHAAAARFRRGPRSACATRSSCSPRAPEFSDCRIADYGTRRRFSRQWQEEVLLTLKDGLGAQFAGTSNVLLRDGARPDAARHDGARIPAGVPGARAAAARFADLRASTCGRRNIAATSASRCPTSTAWTRSCATSTCSSASSSTARATIPATRSTGASS